MINVVITKWYIVKYPETIRHQLIQFLSNVALAMKPDDADYHNSKGNVLLRMELFPEALKEFDKAISLNPDNSNYHGNRRNAFAENFRSLIDMTPHILDVLGLSD